MLLNALIYFCLPSSLSSKPEYRHSERLFLCTLVKYLKLKKSKHFFVDPFSEIHMSGSFHKNCIRRGEAASLPLNNSLTMPRGPH